MESRGRREFGQHFGSVGHWAADVTYRVHCGLPVYNKLMDPMELSDLQRDDYLARPFKDKFEGFSFPEELLPS